jgi:hypothetical protein
MDITGTIDLLGTVQNWREWGQYSTELLLLSRQYGIDVIATVRDWYYRDSTALMLSRLYGIDIIATVRHWYYRGSTALMYSRKYGISIDITATMPDEYCRESTKVIGVFATVRIWYYRDHADERFRHSTKVMLPRQCGIDVLATLQNLTSTVQYAWVHDITKLSMWVRQEGIYATARVQNRCHDDSTAWCIRDSTVLMLLWECGMNVFATAQKWWYATIRNWFTRELTELMMGPRQYSMDPIPTLLNRREGDNKEYWGFRDSAKVMLARQYAIDVVATIQNRLDSKGTGVMLSQHYRIDIN